MIKRLKIKNFKSIKDLQIDCRRINIFIGEPNAGKSNFLEALGLLSWGGYLHNNSGLGSYIRIKSPQDLFYDNLLDQPVQIICNLKENKCKINIEFKDEDFVFNANISGGQSNVSNNQLATMDYSGAIKKRRKEGLSELAPIKFFRFIKQDNFPNKSASFLMPPHGSNLFAIVMSNKSLKETMGNFFKNFGYNLVLKPQERVFEFQKMEDDIVTSFHYVLSSDTIQRIIFYVIAMESNKNSILIFEEPESHAFPYYTKYLGERIAFDESNQYFIATHNPYLIKSIIEKAKSNQISVFATYLKDYQTNVKLITDNQLSSLLDSDPFFNISMFIEGES